MNEELQKVLAELIGSTIEAKDFLLSELPDVINQLLWWHGIKSLLSFAAAMVMAAIHVKVTKVVFRSIRDKNSYLYKTLEGWNTSDALGFSALLGIILLIPSALLLSLDWLQILIAPKLYLIEYAAKLVG